MPVSAALTGLIPGTLYHFRLTATNSGGTVNGEDGSFTADVPPPGLPIVVTGDASNIGDTTATLNATVNPAGSETTYQFEYGLTTTYGSTTTICQCRKRVYSSAGECGIDWLEPRDAVSLPRNGHEWYRDS